MPEVDYKGGAADAGGNDSAQTSPPTLTMAIQMLESGRASEAMPILKSAAAVDSGNATARFNLGLAYERTDQIESAKEEYLAALALNPAHEGALNNFTNLALRAFSEIDKCLSLARATLEVNPKSAIAWANLGRVELKAANVEAAVHAYSQATSLRSNVDWAACKLFAMGYLKECPMDMIFKEHRRWHADFAAPLEKSPPLASPLPRGGRKLRVGYVSSDFRRHSVAYFIEPVLHCHDRRRFDGLCYSDVARPDDVTRRISSMPLAWRDISGMDDDAAARLAAADHLDILIDLNGHTWHRLLLFARRPAPVQITWLGYPFTTGLDSIQFRATDIWADPEGQEAFHSEKLLRIPGGFNVFAPPGAAPECGRPPCHQTGVFTFASFNNLAKINASVAKAWGMILQAAPKARLLLKNSSLESPGVRARIIATLEANGARPGQLVIQPYAPRLHEHMNAYLAADAALDTFPYNGVTTTCEALWMGVPVITMVGGHHCGRTGFSMLRRMGLDWFCAHSVDEYVKKAVVLAQSPEMISSLRPALRAIMAERLGDATKFTATWEDEIAGIKN